MSSHHSIRRLARAVPLGLVAAVTLAGAPAAAKEPAGVISMNPTPPPADCQAVQSLKARGDSRVGDTATSSIEVDYSVKPCDSKQIVTVETVMWENFEPGNVVWDDTAAPLSGAFTVYGVKLDTNYRVTVIVRDAATAAEVSRSSILASADTRTTA